MCQRSLSLLDSPLPQTAQCSLPHYITPVYLGRHFAILVKRPQGGSTRAKGGQSWRKTKSAQQAWKKAIVWWPARTPCWYACNRLLRCSSPSSFLGIVWFCFFRIFQQQNARSWRTRKELAMIVEQHSSLPARASQQVLGYSVSKLRFSGESLKLVA
jgi:hypothetical protein